MDYIRSLSERYSGLTLYLRLLHVISNAIRLDEKQAAGVQLLTALKSTKYTGLYERAFVLLDGVLSPEHVYDAQWVEDTNKRVELERNHFLSKIQTAKLQIVKETTFQVYHEYAIFLYDCGELAELQKVLYRIREYCSTAKQASTTSLLGVAASMDSLQHYLSTPHIARGELDTNVENISKFKAASALVDLKDRRYKNAARKFLDTGSALGSSFSNVIAPEDIAVYGTICALATLERSVLKKDLLECQNTGIKSFIDLVPSMRTLVQDYFALKFHDCLHLLESLRPTFRFDIHFGHHYDDLVRMITERFVIQYFSPYQTVDLRKMAVAVGMEMAELEKFVSRLITEGSLPARIDSANLILRRNEFDERQQTMQKVLAVTEKHTEEMRSSVLRLSVMRHNFKISDDIEHAEAMSVFRDSSGGGMGGRRRGKKATGYMGGDDGDDDFEYNSGDEVDFSMGGK
jgi:COP9 signalosome complex subunit 1